MRCDLVKSIMLMMRKKATMRNPQTRQSQGERERRDETTRAEKQSVPCVCPEVSTRNEWKGESKRTQEMATATQKE